jgi:hypothetical protein
MVGTTALAAYVGHETPGLLGAEISAVVPAYVGTLFAQRKDNLVTVTEEAAEQAGMDGAALVAWIKADDRHAAFFADALEAAWSTLDLRKLRLLARVLAEGFRNEAPRLDIDREVVRTFRELETTHLRVLDEIAQAEGDTETPHGVSVKWLRNRLPGWSEGMDALVAGLQRTGCLASSDGESAGGFYGNPPLAVTPFGHRCLEIVRREADSLPEE